MNPILTLSLAPLRLPVKMEEVRAAAPAAFRKSLRPVNACAMSLVVSGFADPEMRRGRHRTPFRFAHRSGIIESHMLKSRTLAAFLGSLLIIGGAVIAQPKRNVSAARHPNLAAAQRLSQQAFEKMPPQQNLWGDSGSGSRPKL